MVAKRQEEAPFDREWMARMMADEDATRAYWDRVNDEKKSKTQQQQCSFCGESSGFILAGPCVYICRGCVLLCTKMLCEVGALDAAPIPPDTVTIMRGVLRRLGKEHAALRSDIRRWLKEHAPKKRRRA